MTLHMMVGLPRSGKSTLANEMSKELGYPIVCPDDIRLALHGQAFVPEAEPMVWAIAKVMVASLFRRHDDVILDSCMVTKARRDEWKKYKRKFYVVDTDIGICLDRGPELQEVIDKMYSEWETVEDND